MMGKFTRSFLTSGAKATFDISKLSDSFFKIALSDEVSRSGLVKVADVLKNNGWKEDRSKYFEDLYDSTEQTFQNAKGDKVLLRSNVYEGMDLTSEKEDSLKAVQKILQNNLIEKTRQQ